MEKKSGMRADLLLLGGLLLTGIVLGAVLLFSSAGGAKAIVRVDGTVTAELPLSRDTVMEIAGVNGGTNLLIIENGEAYLREASCPDGLCVGMGKISRTGQSIVCLPNRVSIEIAGSGEAEVDAVVG